MHTHTHTHIYIYIYIYTWVRISKCVAYLNFRSELFTVYSSSQVVIIHIQIHTEIILEYDKSELHKKIIFHQQTTTYGGTCVYIYIYIYIPVFMLTYDTFFTCSCKKKGNNCEITKPLPSSDDCKDSQNFRAKYIYFRIYDTFFYTKTKQTNKLQLHCNRRVKISENIYDK